MESDSEGLGWEEGDYADPAYDTDSTGDSDLESTRTADLSDSENELQSSSGSESDVDIEVERKGRASNGERSIFHNISTAQVQK